MLTQKTQERELKAAIAQIGELSSIKKPVKLIRLETLG